MQSVTRVLTRQGSHPAWGISSQGPVVLTARGASLPTISFCAGTGIVMLQPIAIEWISQGRSGPSGPDGQSVEIIRILPVLMVSISPHQTVSRTTFLRHRTTLSTRAKRTIRELRRLD